MLSSNILLRTYTPPTCTLEIWGKRSPLSVWAKRNLLKEVHFELRFDDPKMTVSEQVTAKGDQTQLQLLSEVVSSYVQNLLVTTPAALPLNSTTNSNNLSTLQSSFIPSIQPKGLLIHELSFGSITPEASQPTIQLSVSQLFDLANALEDYNNEAELLPQLGKISTRKAVFAWTSLAAATVLAVGLTANGIRLYRSEQQVALDAFKSQPSPFKEESIPSVPPPPTGTSAPSPNLPTTLSDTKTLPTPSNVQTVPSPSRNPSIPLVVPPQPVLPPPPPVTSAPTKTTITIPQETAELPDSSGTNAPASVSSDVLNSTPASPNLPKLPSLEEETLETRSRGETGNSLDTAQEPQSVAKVTPSPSLLDTIPQVTEARDYFQQRWQPPESLKQTLEYRLVLNQDGSIAQIVPLGQAAQIYLDRTSMPLIGEPFVSPLEVAGNPQLRLVLSPDGGVRTFLEQ